MSSGRGLKTYATDDCFRIRNLAPHVAAPSDYICNHVRGVVLLSSCGGLQDVFSVVTLLLASLFEAFTGQIFGFEFLRFSGMN